MGVGKTNIKNKSYLNMFGDGRGTTHFHAYCWKKIK
jgi:hypothetical protein